MPQIEQLLETDGFYISPIVGFSMEPLLREGRDLVYIKRASGCASIKRGDVVLFRQENGIYVLHRVLQVKNGHILECGDNRYAFTIIPCERILGVMTHFNRKGKSRDVKDWRYRLYTGVKLVSGFFKRTFLPRARKTLRKENGQQAP